MKFLAIFFCSLALIACGGGVGDLPVAAIKAVPQPVRAASVVTGGNKVAVHVYQALYGQAPSNVQLSSFLAQIGTGDGFTWASSIASNFNNLSDSALSTLVLNNINITPTSLTATATFGTSLQAYTALQRALADYFGSVGIGNRGIVIVQLAEIMSNLEVDTQFGVYGGAAIAFNKQVAANYTYGSNAANLAAAAVPLSTANAGSAQTVVVGQQVALDGTGSSSAYGVALAYAWTLTAKPSGSLATLSSASAVKPTFKADVAGTYVASLTVNDGKVNSNAATVSITAGVDNVGMVLTLAGSETYGNSDGQGASASFTALGGISVDLSGNVYVADTVNSQIRKISPSGWVSTLAGDKFRVFTENNFVDGPGSIAKFNFPYSATVDSSGNVYVADTGNNAIRKVAPDGVVSTLAGSGVEGSADGVGTGATFYVPRGTAVDTRGNIFVADGGNHKIRKITPDGLVTTFAGSGVEGNADGTGQGATFTVPNGLAFDSAGYLYVADIIGVIRKITPTAVVTTLAGSGRYESANGTGTAASFKQPTSVAVDSAGNVYVAERGNAQIRKISPIGVVTTFAPSSLPGYYIDGAISVASFNAPWGLAFDASGNLYISDGIKIRKITFGQ